MRTLTTEPAADATRIFGMEHGACDAQARATEALCYDENCVDLSDGGECGGSLL